MRIGQKYKQQENNSSIYKNQHKNIGSELSKQEESLKLNEIGSQLYKQGKFKQSIEYHLQVLKRLPGFRQLDETDQKQKLVAIRFISLNYKELRKYKKGLKYCNLHLEQSELFKNDEEIQSAYCNLGLLYMDQAESYLQKNKLTSEEFERTIDLSLSNLEKSAVLIKKMIDSSQKNINQHIYLQNLNLQYADCLYNQANALFVKGKWDSVYYAQSIQKLKDTLKEVSQNQYDILKGKCYNTMGLIYLEQKEYSKAIEYFFKDADICLSQKDYSGQVDDYLNVGLAYQAQKQYNLSQKYFKLAIEISKKHQIESKKNKCIEQLNDLEREQQLRKQCEEFEMRKKESYIQDKNKQLEYCETLQKIEEYQKIIEFTSFILQHNPKNVEIIIQKAIAEERLKKFNESKASYEQAIQIYQKVGKATLEYANCLNEYANVLDELKYSVDLIKYNYEKSLKIAEKLGDVYLQKVILSNLDIIYEQRKMNKQRRENAKLLRKLIAQNPDLNMEDQSQDSDSSDSDSSDLNLDEDEDGNSDDEGILQSKNGTMSKNNSKNLISKSKNTQNERKQENTLSKVNQSKQIIQKLEVEEENEKINISLRRKKNQSRIMEDESDDNDEEEEETKDKHQYSNKENNNDKVNKNFFKQETSSNVKQNQNLIAKPQIHNTLVGNSRDVDIKQKILEVYEKKCQKYFISKDENLVKILEKINDLNLKKQYQIDIKLAPFFKAIRKIDDLQILDLSYNLLTNVSLKQFNFLKYNKNLTKLNLAYNYFYYDDRFYQILYSCQELQNLISLNISGLSIQHSYYDQIWGQIVQIKQLKSFKFKNSDLESLPSFLSTKIKESQIECLNLKNNYIDSQNVTAITLIENFREGFKVYF